MRFPARLLTLVGAVLAALAASCQESGGGGAPSGAGGLPSNLGLAARVVVGAERLWLASVPEADQGARDGNGDGDAEDEVVVVIDLAHARVVHPGLALARAGGPPALLACDGSVAAFAVDEAAQARDLDEDGDAEDRVLFVFDPATGSLRNVARAVNALAVGGALVAFAVDEAGEGADLDADGDATGSVLSVFDLRDGSTVDLGLRDSAPLLVHDDYVALFLAEREGLDLSFDGDDDDESVFEVYDGRTRLLHNTTLVLAGRAVCATDGTFGFPVSEAAQRRDLSGDGDTEDAVLHVYLPALAFSRNLRLSAPLFPPPAVDGRRYLLRALESQDGLDHNSDGDQDDLVVYVYEPATDTLVATGLASGGSAVLVGDWLGISVSEAMQGTRDLDGDGEAGGDVAHVFDLATGSVEGLGIDTFALHGSGVRLFLEPFEAAAGTDWNQDGDQLDRVLFDWSAADGRTRGPGLALGSVLAVQGDHALVTAQEGERGGDRNGDGDADDFLLELYDARTGSTRALGLGAGRFAALNSRLDVIALVEEAAQGRDLDGDGDLLDEVLHVIELR